jgi:hypothetical protein
LPVIPIVGDEQTDLLKSCIRIEQPRDALACRQLSLRVLALDLIRAAALSQALFQHAKFYNERFEMRGIGIGRGFRLCLSFHRAIACRETLEKSTG